MKIMKKGIILAGILILSLCTSCSLKGTNDKGSADFTEKLNAYFGSNGKSVTYKDLPETEAEVVVADYFYFDQSDNYDELLELFSEDNREAMEISIENVKESDTFIQTFIVNELVTFSGEQVDEIDDTLLKSLPRFEATAKALNRWSIVSVKFTQQWNSLERAPQWGNGDYTQLFLVGTDERNGKLKIHMLGMR